MLKKFYLWIITFFLIFPLGVACADAGEVYYYQHSDDTLSFVARDIHLLSRWGVYHKLPKMEIEVHKVVAPDKTYYAVRACVKGKAFTNTSISGLILALDGKEFDLVPLQGARIDEMPGFIQAWYSINDEMILAMSKVSNIKITLKTASGKVLENKPSRQFAQSLQRLCSITKENYINQELIDENPKFKLFIPGAKPEEIGPALTYKMNYANYKGKDEFLYSYYYKVTRSDDWRTIALEGQRRFWKDGFLDGDRYDYPYIWITMKPQDGGTWISIDTLAKEYQNNVSYFRIRPKEKILTSHLYEIDKWAETCMWLSKLYNGTYNYGLDWTLPKGDKDTWKAMREEWNPGPFVIRTIDAKFPELAQVAPNDVITEINNFPTMYIKDSLISTLYSGKPITFTIQDGAGNIKKVFIKPKFEPSNSPKTNYMDIISKDSRQFEKYEFDEVSPSTMPVSYNPLGNGI